MIIRQAKELQPLQSVLLDGLLIYSNDYIDWKPISGKTDMNEYVRWYPHVIECDCI